MASLFVIRGRDSGQHFELLSVSTTLGREATNQIQLHDTEVSRHHARLDRGLEGQWFLVDLGSSNGSFVNSQRVAKHTLTSGDRIQLGSTLMIFSATSEALTSSQPATHHGGAQDVSIVRNDRDDLSQIRRTFALNRTSQARCTRR